MNRHQGKVTVADKSAPWEVDGDGDGDKRYKYKYHPEGDYGRDPKKAPSALHTVVTRPVSLPKVCETFCFS
jgi:hypothetical protein